ncbi:MULTISPECIES: hypothetical protein [Brevibacterium]|uniref:Single-stranded DNA-binding protein n=1 Tax=Brevibacterium gallinarum TaxID=2762220 RepID=A0ABR8WT25_9MICO|nr:MULTISPECIES: hypothetical protein [Brevibacterium]MBD8020224.1 hypothetical protein [Brevibacterium gallinarum]
MPVPTGPGISGFIKSRPQLSMTVNNDPRFSAWVGIPQTQIDENGVLQELEPLETRMVMFGASAQRAHEKFRRGDDIVAFGANKEYTATRDGQQVTEEYFLASHIGHDNNVTTYTVHRGGPERYAAERDGMQREAVRQDAVAREKAQQQAAGQQPVGQQAPAQQQPGQQAPAQAAPAQQAPAQQQPAQTAPAQPAQQAPQQPAQQQAAPQQPVAPQPPVAPPQNAPVQQEAPAAAPAQAPPAAPNAGPPDGQQPQAGQAPAGDPVAEVLAQRQNEVAAEPAPARAEPPGHEAMSR